MKTAAGTKNQNSLERRKGSITLKLVSPTTLSGRKESFRIQLSPDLFGTSDDLVFDSPKSRFKPAVQSNGKNENSVAAIGVAAVTGVVIGFLIGRFLR